jgi:hypothetical protein
MGGRSRAVDHLRLPHCLVPGLQAQEISIHGNVDLLHDNTYHVRVLTITSEQK